MTWAKNEAMETANKYHKRFSKQVKAEVEEIEKKVREKRSRTSVNRVMWSFFSGCQTQDSC
jgi:hypothetical protein